ncbi:hypothetical protein OE88DRAFT_575445 [Heliocybe sulcata]|uniref:Mid2 domain-containing protein n=1 Tax=Heliocybe sulcata TaxID=5364 RepID=A0A5C3MU83_9AGAM|nr:hypothetical protein OE88DRAFT_575445 [Heliocybe sulcata]
MPVSSHSVAAFQMFLSLFSFLVYPAFTFAQSSATASPGSEQTATWSGTHSTLSTPTKIAVICAAIAGVIALIAVVFNPCMMFCRRKNRPAEDDEDVEQSERPRFGNRSNGTEMREVHRQDDDVDTLVDAPGTLPAESSTSLAKPSYDAGRYLK